LTKYAYFTFNGMRVCRYKINGDCAGNPIKVVANIALVEGISRGLGAMGATGGLPKALAGLLLLLAGNMPNGANGWSKL